MMMPANFSAVNAEVVYGGAVADYLPNAWTAANVKQFSTNIITLVSNSFFQRVINATLGTMFSGNWGSDGVKLFGDEGSLTALYHIDHDITKDSQNFGNKIMTTGAGGFVVSNHADWAEHAKHLSTQAKADMLQFLHDEVGSVERISHNAANVSRRQHHSVGAFVVEEFSDSQLVGQIEFGMCAAHQIVVAALFEVLPNGRAHQSAVPSHIYFRIFIHCFYFFGQRVNESTGQRV